MWEPTGAQALLSCSADHFLAPLAQVTKTFESSKKSHKELDLIG